MMMTGTCLFPMLPILHHSPTHITSQFLHPYVTHTDTWHPLWSLEWSLVGQRVTTVTDDLCCFSLDLQWTPGEDRSDTVAGGSGILPMSGE